MMLVVGVLVVGVPVGLAALWAAAQIVKRLLLLPVAVWMSWRGRGQERGDGYEEYRRRPGGKVYSTKQRNLSQGEEIAK
ncbi:hypothetical protein [Frankia gtarii]|uniref:hypothetical protein n=1 Tax=Frankia gtarii TaxID=2950102 RepID=UPI0021C0BBD0|nr:hypothetical protein [Frankia gtarii]